MAPDNDEWYSSQGFISIDSDNKFDNGDTSIPMAFVNQIFQSCVCHTYLDGTNSCNMTMMKKSVTIWYSRFYKAYILIKIT